eukprot:4058376-Prymnesium_polylepis.1
MPDPHALGMQCLWCVRGGIRSEWSASQAPVTVQRNMSTAVAGVCVARLYALLFVLFGARFWAAYSLSYRLQSHQVSLVSRPSDLI